MCIRDRIETLDFADVSTDAYYYEAVKWAAKKGITGGIGNGLFGPNQPCARAQIVTFLWLSLIHIYTPSAPRFAARYWKWK